MGIILLGAFVAGAWDLSFDASAYTTVFISNICSAIYLTSIARIGNGFSYFFSCLIYVVAWNFFLFANDPPNFQVNPVA